MKVLMVCLGNICRSPMAQGILEHKLEVLKLDWDVDSAGTSGWHDGENPDTRATNSCKKRGIDISNQRSRKLTSLDLDDFDLILAMDSSNYQDIIKLCTTNEQKSKIQLISNIKYPGKNTAVPDPYYDNKFDNVFELLDDFIDGLVMVSSNQN